MNNDIEILQEKITRVEKDLHESMTEDNSEKKRTVLADYLDYLKDELRMLQNDDRR